MIQTNRYSIDVDVISVLKKIQKHTSMMGDTYLKDIKDGEPAIMVTCPFHKNHNENKPACGVFKENHGGFVAGDFHCFACGSRGSILKLVSKCLGKSENDAEDWLFNTFGGVRGKILNLKKIELPTRYSSKKNNRVGIDERVLEKFDFYHPYMEKRKLSKKYIDMFRVGYDELTESLTFPVWDEKGRLQFITERSVNSKRFNIPKNVEKPLYLLNFVLKENSSLVMITEAQIDAITAWQYGVPCCATMGVPSEHQIELLNKSGIRNLILAFDNDEYGKKFSKMIKSRINSGVLLYDMCFPKGKKDINDLTEEEFSQCLDNIGIKIIKRGF